LTRAAPLPAAPPDLADVAMRAELAAPTAPGAGWRPDHGDALAGWRLTTLIRAAGGDIELLPDGRLKPRGFATLPPFLRAEARRRRDALAGWLVLECAAPPELRQHARPPCGAEEALREGEDWCAACGPPPPGALATWWAGPGSREWRCEMCCPPPDDDRITYVYGRSGDDPAPPRAPARASPTARKETFRDKNNP
jgi:hypothetical protein